MRINLDRLEDIGFLEHPMASQKLVVCFLVCNLIDLHMICIFKVRSYTGDLKHWSSLSEGWIFQVF